MSFRFSQLLVIFGPKKWNNSKPKTILQTVVRGFDRSVYKDENSNKTQFSTFTNVGWERLWLFFFF